MTMYCDYCIKEHDDWSWRSWYEDGKTIHVCRTASSSPKTEPIAVIADKKGQRINHWKDIKNRVTTHEGELLSGIRAKTYLQQYGKRYLGIDYKPTNFNSPIYQKELNKKQ